MEFLYIIIGRGWIYLDIETISIIGTLNLIIISVFYDYRTYKISNKLIIAGICFGIAIVFYKLCSGFEVSDNLLGLLWAFIAAMGLYITNAIGAGDCKLFMYLGLITGRKILTIIFVSMIFGVVIGLIENYCINAKWHDKELCVHRFHYSIAIFIAYCLVCVV